MLIQSSEPLKEIIRYEEQLKATSQRIQVLILDDNPANINTLKDFISQQQQLLRYLEIQSSKLTQESKQIYMRNLQKFKKKAKEHKDYIATIYGSKALPVSQQAIFMQYQNQNAALAQNKITMYENQRIQDNMGRDLHEQGQTLYGGIQSNKNIQNETSQAQNTIRLIQISIMKRKLMFGSLIALFVLTLILSLVLKTKKA